MLRKITGIILGCGLVAALSWPGAGMAQGSAQEGDFLPAVTGAQTATGFMPSETTHPPLHMTPDKSEILTLEADAANIVVGSPYTLSIVPETSRRFVLVPQAPGATFFSVIDAEGNILMQRHIVVSAPKEKYVRVRRNCSGAENCNPTDFYWCPDACHSVGFKTLEEKKNEKTKEFESGLETAGKKSGAEGKMAVDAAGADDPASAADENMEQ